MGQKTTNHKQITDLFLEGLEVVNPMLLIEECFRLNDDILVIKNAQGDSEIIKLKEFGKIFIVGAGKASATMALKIEEILGDRISGGVIVTKYGFGKKLKRLELIEAGHPVPDKNGINGTQKIIEVCKNTQENDLIINLISGGASALLPYPEDKITLEEKVEITNFLLKSGATINEMNVIRKHLSKIKGGKLAQYSYPTKIVSLILSDVIGDKLDTIGSGITVKDNSTFKEALSIVGKYNLQNVFPKSAIAHLQKGLEAEKKDQKNMSLKNTTNIIIGNNSLVLNRIKEIAEKIGYKTKIVNRTLEGEASIVGANIAESIITVTKNDTSGNQKYCFLYGGETSVTIRGDGKGGRNQEMVLSAAIKLNKKDRITFLSGGTDGNDGPTDAAGAICDGNTVLKGEKMGMNPLDFLENNDSYNYFKNLNSLLITGPTRTNVIDIQIVLVD